MAVYDTYQGTIKLEEGPPPVPPEVSLLLFILVPLGFGAVVSIAGTK